MIETNELPDWAKKMTDAQWEKKKKADGGIYLKNCEVCGQRLLLTLCKYEESKYYCSKHCPEHKWQSDYDWQTECAKCGISYIHYLQGLLERNKISYSKP